MTKDKWYIVIRVHARTGRQTKLVVSAPDQFTAKGKALKQLEIVTKVMELTNDYFDA